MVEEKIPRRLKRFYRTNQTPQNNNYNYSDNFNSQNYEQSSKIPTMDYEDIDEKNLQEIKKVEQQSLEEKLALLEIEKFKKENKRMPSKEEQDQLASSLYEQFKNNETDNQTAPNQKELRLSPRQRRLQRLQSEKEDNFDIKEEPIIQNQENTNQVSDIKSLFDDDTSKSLKKKDEFDMGLDLDSSDDLEMSEDLEELEDFSMDKKKKKKI